MEILFLLGLLPLLLLFGGSDEPPEVDNGRMPEDEVIEGGNSPTEGDSIDGGDGFDLIFGRAGPDQLDGGADADIVVGESWGDTLSGGDGVDLLVGGGGDDVLSGDGDDDDLLGGAGDDDLQGGDGNDGLIDVSGRDTLSGGEGDDLLGALDVAGRFDPSFLISDEVTTGLLGLVADFYGDDVSAGQITRLGEAINSADGDTSADVLDGGGGNDDLVGDLGDTLTGGEGNDFFSVVNDGALDACTITDYDPATEGLEILVWDAAPNVISVVDNPGGDGAFVQVDGETAAWLQGVTAASVNLGAISTRFI